jgi:hypothetical protein
VTLESEFCYASTTQRTQYRLRKLEPGLAARLTPLALLAEFKPGLYTQDQLRTLVKKNLDAHLDILVDYAIIEPVKFNEQDFTYWLQAGSTLAGPPIKHLAPPRYWYKVPLLTAMAQPLLALAPTMLLSTQLGGNLPPESRIVARPIPIFMNPSAQAVSDDLSTTGIVGVSEKPIGPGLIRLLFRTNMGRWYHSYLVLPAAAWDAEKWQILAGYAGNTQEELQDYLNFLVAALRDAAGKNEEQHKEVLQFFLPRTRRHVGVTFADSAADVLYYRLMPSPVNTGKSKEPMISASTGISSLDAPWYGKLYYYAENEKVDVRATNAKIAEVQEKLFEYGRFSEKISRAGFSEFMANATQAKRESVVLPTTPPVPVVGPVVMHYVKVTSRLQIRLSKLDASLRTRLTPLAILAEMGRGLYKVPELERLIKGKLDAHLQMMVESKLILADSLMPMKGGYYLYPVPPKRLGDVNNELTDKVAVPAEMAAYLRTLIPELIVTDYPGSPTRRQLLDEWQLAKNIINEPTEPTTMDKTTTTLSAVLAEPSLPPANDPVAQPSDNQYAIGDGSELLKRDGVLITLAHDKARTMAAMQAYLLNKPHYLYQLQQVETVEPSDFIDQ